jgi:hypothetical protein
MTYQDELLQHVLERTDALLELIDSWSIPPTDDTERTVSATLMIGTLEVENALIDAREAVQKLIKDTNEEYERKALPVRMCQCDDTDNSLCSIHTVGHVWVAGCCDSEEDAHRHPTPDEWKVLAPEIFKETVVVGDGRKYRVDAHKYSDGANVCITYLFADSEDEDDDAAGLCFDMPMDALQAVLPLLERASKSLPE